MEENKLTQAVLVGVAKKGYDNGECEKSLEELERLLDTAGGESCARVVQSKNTPDPRTLIGSGKVKEISELCKNNQIELCIFDTELSPSKPSSRFLICEGESSQSNTARVISAVLQSSASSLTFPEPI